MMQKETVGGCIDPKTLASLLSSVTSVTYELNVLGVDLPRDPFRKVKKFLQGWAEWRTIAVSLLTTSASCMQQSS